MGRNYVAPARLAPDLLVVTGPNNAALGVHLTSSGPLTLQALRLPNPGRPETTRLGIKLTEPSLDGFIRARIALATAEMLAKARPLDVGDAPARLLGLDSSYFARSLKSAGFSEIR